MKISPFLAREKKIVIVVALCALIFASSLAYFYYVEVLRPLPPRMRKKAVAVIKIEGPILSTDVADVYADAIERAIRNDTISAVVLLIDSPGGEVTKIERIYSELLELKGEKPLISSVINALSGGYYIAVAADYIYVLPSSAVGNIGVIAQEPPTQPPSEEIIETGAYKLSGSSRLSFLQDIKTVLDNFVSAVESGRGDRLKLSTTELKRAIVYTGVEAVSLGLADEIGSTQRAVEKAAEEAGLTQYAVIDLTQPIAKFSQAKSSLNQTHSTWKQLNMQTLSKLNPPPAIYYLYLPPAGVAVNTSRVEAGAERSMEKFSTLSGGSGSVVVDLSHGNRISGLDLETFTWELIERNVTVKFINSWSELKKELENSTALIIALPTAPYSSEELKDIKGFVKGGGILLLLFDPAAEYSRMPASLEAINSVANLFRLSFAGGYLYNEEKYYGIYRNIYISDFADSALTQNVTSLVFFTATYIRCVDQGIAWAPANTYSSQSERTGRYAVAALSKNNGTVIALGDVTFLKEPYCYLEDNYNFISNLAAYIASQGPK